VRKLSILTHKLILKQGFLASNYYLHLLVNR
jgi:hypothetical protein